MVQVVVELVQVAAALAARRRRQDLVVRGVKLGGEAFLFCFFVCLFVCLRVGGGRWGCEREHEVGSGGGRAPRSKAKRSGATRTGGPTARAHASSLPRSSRLTGAPRHAPLGLVVAIIARWVVDRRLAAAAAADAADRANVAAPQIAVQDRRRDGVACAAAAGNVTVITVVAAQVVEKAFQVVENRLGEPRQPCVALFCFFGGCFCFVIIGLSAAAAAAARLTARTRTKKNTQQHTQKHPTRELQLVAQAALAVKVDPAGHPAVGLRRAADGVVDAEAKAAGRRGGILGFLVSCVGFFLGAAFV